MIIGRGAENAENIVPTAKQYIELLRTIEYFNQTEKIFFYRGQIH